MKEGNEYAEYDYRVTLYCSTQALFLNRVKDVVFGSAYFEFLCFADSDLAYTEKQRFFSEQGAEENDDTFVLKQGLS
jgi:hypothetical protein